MLGHDGMKINFYTGPECHLCDVAHAIVSSSSEAMACDWQMIDVRQDTELYHLYAARIPVLQRQDNQQCLFWPFDLHALEQFLS